jgi:hypothetical protein
MYVGQVAIYLGPIGLMVTNRKPAQLGRYVDKDEDWILEELVAWNFLVLRSLQTASRDNSASCSVTTGVKRSVREAHHSLPSGPGVKKEWP